MKNDRNSVWFAIVGIFWLYLVTVAVHAAEAVKPADTGEMAAVSSDVPADGQNENIIDRAFSPLDKAVADINRDLDDGDGGAAGESSD